MDETCKALRKYNKHKQISGGMTLEERDHRLKWENDVKPNVG
jgi:hypothetical protein